MNASLGSNERAVLGALQGASRPQSAYDLLDLLHGTNIRAAQQVYRSLNKLMAEGHVHRVESLNAFVACHCAHASSAPGFLLCTCCGDVTEFDAGKAVRDVEDQIARFKVEQPSLELKGLCAHCQTEGHNHGEAR